MVGQCLARGGQMIGGHVQQELGLDGQPDTTGIDQDLGDQTSLGGQLGDPPTDRGLRVTGVCGQGGGGQARVGGEGVDQGLFQGVGVDTIRARGLGGAGPGSGTAGLRVARSAGVRTA